MHRITQNFIVILVINFIIQNVSFSQALIGEITKDDFQIKRPQVIDAITKKPISGAKVSIPIENKVDFTNKDGFFKLVPSENGPVILSVQKDGYRPFSITIHDGKFSSGTLLELQKFSPKSIIISDNMMHLGDNSFSKNSAGACLINSPCVGPSFSQKFKVGEIKPTTKAYVTIGSIIGIDTIQAMKLGQNKLTNAASSPMEIFINKHKIGELKINGDNQKIPIPTKYLNNMAENTLTIQTGINQDVKEYIDYDDVELMNLIVDVQ